jgi:fumarate hydratase subunit alpha
MRSFDCKILTHAVKQLCIEANLYSDKELRDTLAGFMEAESNPLAKDVLKVLLKNHELAAEEKLPLCQDTGMVTVFAEIGQKLCFSNGDFRTAIQEGVRQGYEEAYLRKSVVKDPIFRRLNSKDNTPAIIYPEIVAGERLKLTLVPKGGGADNMSSQRMFLPTAELAEVKDFVVETIRIAGGKPCPPVIVGVGIGGSFDYSAYLAKKATTCAFDQHHPDEKWHAVEEDLLASINKLNIGPQGFGGDCTALAVHILTYPCHIASLPVAVNIQCHLNRHKTILL